ncbi:2-keto-4-pentenoate hydratase [Pararhizobium gei]|uniref:2-keto-4-pentenoate hydratase n=1 Tax=Pararhizobium gei TaxID=1395951 RepID=UPI0023D9A3A9|nr:2-keto-4-pentenoate hydratase [Rhizobium gei]
MTETLDLARQLSDADRSGVRLASGTLFQPRSAIEAVTVQNETLALNGWLPAGYKIAIRPDGTSVSAPMAHITVSDGGGTAQFERPAIDALEVEICFSLADDLPPAGDQPYTRETLKPYIGDIHSGVEFLGHRLDNGNTSPALLFLADRLGNTGYVVGETLGREVLEPGLSLPLTVTLNGDVVFEGPGKHPNNDPLAPFVAFANALTAVVPKGCIITTGSLCGAIPMAPGHSKIAVTGFTTLTLSTASVAGIAFTALHKT